MPGARVRRADPAIPVAAPMGAAAVVLGFAQGDELGQCEVAAPTGAAAVVLAAGAGTRFAGRRHKLLTEVAGVPLVRRVVDSARAAGLDETVVVMGAVDLLGVLPDDVTVLHNDDWQQGQATSLIAAVGYAGSRGHRAVVFGLGDQPGVPTSAWAAVGGCDHDLAVADFGGLRRPPVRIGAALWSHLPLTGDQGARVLLRRRPELVRAIPCEGSPHDIDTLEDLRGWNRTAYAGAADETPPPARMPRRRLDAGAADETPPR